MKAKRFPSESLPHSRHRLVIWLGVFSFLLSLLSPVVAIQATAQENLAQRLQGEPPNCEENFEPNDEGTECVPIAGNGETDLQGGQQSPLEDQQQDQEQDQQDALPPDEQQQESQQDQQLPQDDQQQDEQPPLPEDQEQGQQESQQPPADEQSQAQQLPPDDQPQDQTCPAGQTWDQSAGACVQDLNAPPLQEQQIDDPQQDQPTEQSGDIILHKYACPDDSPLADPSNASISALRQECQQPLQVTFSIYDQNNQPVAQTTTSQSSGEANARDVPAGQLTIAEQLPAGYVSIVVHCSDHPSGQGNFAGQSEAVPTLNNSSFRWNLQPGWVLDCYAFNIPAEEPSTIEDYNYLDFSKFYCQSPAAPPADADLSWYEANCNPVPQWDFQLQWAGGQGTETTDANGQASWSGLPTGTWIVTESQFLQISSDFPVTPIVWCRYVEWPEQAGVTGEWARYEASNDSYSNGFGSDQMRMECRWYDIFIDLPDDEAQQPPPDQQDEQVEEAQPAEDADYNSLDLYKYFCQIPALPPSDAALSWYEDNCAATAQWDFNLQWDGGSSFETTDPIGRASWSGLPTGTWTATEFLPDFYETPVVWCRYTEWPEGAGVTGEWAKFEAPNGVYSNGFGYDQMRMECRFYNVSIEEPETEDEYAIIRFEKYWCPSDLAFAQPGTTIDPATLIDLIDACEETGPGGTRFSLDGPNPPYDDLTIDGSPGASRTWEDLLPGNYTVTEELPDGASYRLQVICSTVTATGQPTSPQAWEAINGNSVQWAAEPGYGLYCAFYNIALEDVPVAQDAAYNYLDLSKFYCPIPPEPSVDATLNWYEDNCDPVAQWDFQLEWTGGESTETTNADGQASWSGLPTGTWTATEPQLQPGDLAPAVWCRYTEWPEEAGVTGEWALFEAPGGVYSSGFGYEQMRMECRFYNIFIEDENIVTVYKWDCLPGTEYGRALTYYQVADQDEGPCETEHLNVPMDLIDANGGHPMPTQANGTQWADVALQDGRFQITEQIPPGYGDPMVFCGPLDQDTQSPAAAPGGAVTLTPATQPFNYQCNWYNIPVEDEYQLEVYKYLCAPEVDANLGLPDLSTICSSIQGVSFTATFDATPTSARYTDSNGRIIWTDASMGAWSLHETMLPGWGPPKVFCGPPQTAETPEVPVIDLAVSGTLDNTTPRILCYWFNFELEQENSRITVYKYQCPPGTRNSDFVSLQESCIIPFNGVNFTLRTADTTFSASTSGGAVNWLDLDQGTYTIREQLLPGYEQPLVWCSYVTQDGVSIDPADYQFSSYPVTEGAIQIALNNVPARIICYWYNFPTAPGEITINKWLCPPGYDMQAWSADPRRDCATPQNGVTFALDRPEGADLMTSTGDSLPGAVRFSGLNPGAYTVTETVPPDIASVFVLDCIGTNIPKVHQHPLSWGNRLDVNVAADDSIVCNWYNVPYPENGWITLHKYQCWTATFTSAVDCEIYEFGASFELFGAPSGASHGTGTTNAAGVYTWNDLEPASYRLDEFSARPCKVTSTKVDSAGNARVDAGEGTVIKVYNCRSTSMTPTTPSTTPKSPGKAPGKYPNTGTAPLGSDSVQPAMQVTPEGTPQDEALVDEYYRLSCLVETPDVPAATPAAMETDTAGATATPEEFDLAIEVKGAAPSTPEAIIAREEPTPTPASLSGVMIDLDAPDAPADQPAVRTNDRDDEQTAEEDCPRGALPTRVVVGAANVDAEVETLEIIDGVMQQPTGPTDVTWYKETGRLGEPNNMVIAGHLNWWNVPEGVFYRLQDLQEGDRVEITGSDGLVYVYEVQWVRQESNLEPPAADVIGPTDEPTLTLITCGGEWNADIAEYEERTVARAVQVDVAA